MRIYPKQFYVYMYLREDGTPYYIGKGKHNRAWVNTGRTINRPQDESRIAIHTDNLTEEQALSLEIELIAEYGRKDNGTGILRNLTDGGEGTSGRILSEDEKQAISLRMRGLHKGRVLSENHKRKCSAALRGRRFTKEHRDKISAATCKAVTGDGVNYNSVTEAALAHSVDVKTIRRWVQKKASWSFI